MFKSVKIDQDSVVLGIAIGIFMTGLMIAIGVLYMSVVYLDNHPMAIYLTIFTGYGLVPTLVGAVIGIRSYLKLRKSREKDKRL